MNPKKMVRAAASLRVVTADELGGAPLYRYRAADTQERLARLRELIVDDVHYFSRPSEFNDPWDCKPIFAALPATNSLDRIRRLQRANENLKRVGVPRAHRRREKKRIVDELPRTARSAEMRKRGWEALDEYLLLSLSIHRDQLLMWSHYAAAHNGVCLELPSTALPFSNAGMVRYERQLPTVDVVRGDLQELAQASLFTKADVWAYEDEYRLPVHRMPIVPSDPYGMTFLGGQKYKLPRPGLTGLILGCALTADARETILRWARDRPRPPAVTQARRSEAEYRLDFEPVTL